MKGIALTLALALVAFPALAQPKTSPAGKAAAVASTATTTPRDPASFLADLFAKLAAKGTADLEAADALASAIDPDTGKMRDELAHACYPAMIKFIGSIPQPDASAVGPAVIFERGRLARMVIQSGFPNYLKIGCAPLMQDEANLLVRLAAMVGIAITLPPGLLPVPGLVPGL